MINKKVAVLVENNYEDQELWYPYLRFIEAGFDVTIIGTEANVEYKGKYGYPVKSQMCRFDALKENWDAIIIPGGWAPDKLRRYKEVLELIRTANERKAVIGAICHAGWLLVSADIIRSKKVTSFYAIKDDLINAGGNWVDEEVVIDDNLVTSRTPMDLPVFMKTIINKLTT